MLERQYRSSGDTEALRGLYELVEDKKAVAALDNETIHGSQTIVTDR